SSDEAAKAAYFAVGAGPGFLVTFVGTNLLSCPEVGFCMLAAQILSVIILGVMNKLLFGKNNSYNSNKEIYNSSTSFTSALTEAVISATYGMLEMCGMVVIFSAIISVTERLSGDMRVYLSILLEVTTACNTLSENNSVLLIAFAVGFGGLCVHFQIFTALKNVNFNKGLFFLFRIMQGLITALLTELFIKLFRISLPVFSSVDNTPELSLSSSVIGSAMLIICGVGFLFNIKKLGGKYVRNSRVNRQV
ncbi:MAG: hypothetical protein IJ725_02595, partial [Ruminococcus sp.]|nr:hypothetical protein [Ruminococcus sp.]